MSFPGADQAIHWGYGDPARIAGEAERLAAYERVFTNLGLGIGQFATIAIHQQRVGAA